MRPRSLAFVLLVCAASFLAALATRAVRPAFPAAEVQVEGFFTANGQYPGPALPHGDAVRFWGSWVGNDDNMGAIAIGPFAGPAHLRVAVGGYPSRAGNELWLTLGGADGVLPIRPGVDPGERWEIVDVHLPAAWVGKPVLLRARDAAKGHCGWLAVSEPLRDGLGGGAGELFSSLAAWAINGLWFGLPWLAAVRIVEGRRWAQPHWAPLVASGLVALGALLCFWIFFAHPLAGKIFSVGFVLLGAGMALRRGEAREGRVGEPLAAGRTLALLGLLYLGILHFFPSSREFYGLAANRFMEGLPGDNNLPHYFADFLYLGSPLRLSGTDWLSSDRPPLQIGWLLLTRTLNEVLGLEARACSGTAAVWFQSLWVFAAYGLLRSLRLPRARALAWTALLGLSGFFAQNTVFTWPKLAAAAFACGAVALWTWPRGARPERAEYLLGGLLGGLAWLSHGGVAFSLIALAPWLAWRAWRGEWRGFGLAATAFALLAAPWTVYQKWYDPPGDRLLKWHLAGVIPKDDRGAWQTLRESYAGLKPGEFWAHRKLNFTLQFAGDWRWWRDYSAAGAGRRRQEEFFFTARAFTWWLLGLAALPIGLALGRLRESGAAHAGLAVWSVATLLVWCLLIFTGGHAVIHHGSYAAMLVLFVLLSAWCESASPWSLAVVGGLQAVSFATTWPVPNPTLPGPLNPWALAAAIGAGAALLLLTLAEHRAATPIRLPAAPAQKNV